MKKLWKLGEPQKTLTSSSIYRTFETNLTRKKTCNQLDHFLAAKNTWKDSLCTFKSQISYVYCYEYLIPLFIEKRR